MKKIYERIFDFTLLSLYVLYIIIVYTLYSSQQISIDNGIIKGTFSEKKLREYLDKLQLFFRTFVVFILLVRFNPFMKINFTDFDRKLVFTSALFLISTTGINEFIMSSNHISQNLKNLYSLVI
tara:strand:- start:3067 stop:3438 length:372 start_codon:yes stop_codon:yes gene_type:complete